MSQRDIADTIEDIYGFEISHETISNITDQVIETANEWQNRPLKKFYSFIFVDCLYVNIRKEMETKNYLSNFHCVSKLLCLCLSILLCRSLVSYLNRKYAWYFPWKYWKYRIYKQQLMQNYCYK